ncbi:hypothetical protein M3E13_15580 [Oceanobacillus kimchii]|uniref:hypothetical protein n=1 Tax=Oceanobacillus kimchii TaxID=746691 RepID=UPI0021A5A133|nr:hypothetical protein [Oceanobacillus kimchii]MCT1575686.1 hypothetical protein [Oceanobacillus kimchii]MCT2137316.1 hypothetical protein [Oceanobacillus kimchii]
METEIAKLKGLGKIKLKQREQWYCDSCGQIIKNSKEAMLEWDNFLYEDNNDGYNAKNFRIVHQKKASNYSNCQTDNKKRNLSDGHLHWYVGSGGLSELLSFYDYKKIDHREFNEIIKRIHVDFYEEARIYMNIGFEDGYNLDPHQVGDYSQQDLLFLISEYADKA